MNKQLPKPPYIVGSAGNPSVPVSRTVKGAINYLYPQDFPESSRTPVKAEQICAARDFNAGSSAALSERELRKMLINCATRPALVFAREAIRLRWGADRIDSHMRDFVRSALEWVAMPAVTEFEASAAWRQYEDELVEASKLQAAQSQIPAPSVRAGPEQPANTAPNVESIVTQLEGSSRCNPKDRGADATSFALGDVDSDSGQIIDVVKESITLCYELENVAKSKSTAAAGIIRAAMEDPTLSPPIPNRLVTAMRLQGLNAPQLAAKARAVLKRRGEKRLKVDRATIYRLVNGKTKNPNPLLLSAVFEVLKLSAE
jgi:hypothetical protein